MKPFFVLSMLLVVCSLGTQTLCEEYQYETEDSDWVDPGDMISFDPVLKKNLNLKNKDYLQQDSTHILEQRKPESHLNCPKCPDCKQFASTNTESPNHKPIPSSSIEQSKYNQTQDNIFTKRFLSFYMRKLAYVERPEEYMEYEISIGLNKDTWKTFQGYCDNSSKVSMQEVLHELENTFHHVSISRSTRAQRWKWRFEDYFHIKANEALTIFGILSMLVACLTFEVISKVAWTRQFLRLLVVMFLLSYVSTYARMYQEAVAKQRSSHEDVPEYCKGVTEKSLYDKIATNFRYWFSIAQDPCQKYHNAFNEPIFTVTPLKVLAATLSEFFLEPFEHIGTAFSRTFRNMFAELSVQLWILAFVFVIVAMIAAVLILSVCFGYAWNLRLPFWAGFEIAPGGNAIQARHNEQLLETYRFQIENLNQVIQRMQENRPPIEAGGNEGGWGARIQRMLNFGQNEADDEPNQPPPAALPENLGNLDPDPDVPPPVLDPPPQFDAPLANNDDGLRRRNNVPYPQNPPYPTYQNVVRPCPPPFVEDINRIDGLPEPSRDVSAKQRTFSVAAANLEPASGEPQHNLEQKDMPMEIGFKRHIIEDAAPQLPAYHQVVIAGDKQLDQSKIKLTKVTPQKLASTPDDIALNKDKPCCSKTLQPQQKTEIKSTVSPKETENNEGDITFNPSNKQNEYEEATISSKAAVGGDDSKIEGRSNPEVPAQETEEKAKTPPRGAVEKEEDKFVLIEGAFN